MGDLLLEQQLTPQQQALLVTIPRVAFYFVRHGKTDWNLANRVQGSTDIPLNELGKQQAENVANLLMSHDIASICYSPLSRAKITAQIIGSIKNSSMYEIDDLKERSLGTSEGKEKPDGLDYVLDLLLPLGDIKARKMFGGYGIYQAGIFFALIIDNILYFKVDDSNRSQYESFGSKPFSYAGKNGKTVALSYWEVPIDILENSTKLTLWVQLAVMAAVKAKKPAKKKKSQKGEL